MTLDSSNRLVRLQIKIWVSEDDFITSGRG